MSCGFDNQSAVTFVQYLKRKSSDLSTKKAVIHPGRQPNGIYVLNKSVHIDEEGNIIDVSNSDYVFLSRDLVYDGEKFAACDLTPDITLPLDDSVIVKLILKLKSCTKHNFIQSLLVIASSVMAFHYRQIVTTYSGCPIAIASGESGTGKSTSIAAALALQGLNEKHIFVKGTNSAFLDRSSKSGLPYGIEDPKNNVASKNNAINLGELAVDLYNGSRTANMKTGSLKPLSIPLIASNFQINQQER